MKVLYFHQHFSTPKGATGIRSYEMSRALVKEGHQVTMVCGSYGGGETGIEKPFENGFRSAEVDGINIIEFDLAYSNSDGLIKRSAIFLKFALKSVGLALTETYDVVFATTTPLTAGIPGIFAKLFRRKCFIFEVRDLWPELPKKMGVIKNPIILTLMSLLEWSCYKSADKLIGLSPGIVDGIARRGVDRSKIILIPNGCDLGIFSGSEKAWRPKGVAEDDLMAVFTGTHGIANGLDAVIAAAEVLKRKNCNNVKLVLVGQGKLKQKLQQQAQQLQLTNIIFHPPVEKKKLAGLLASADLGMQILANVPAFYYGTSPNKFFDYIAAGLPVINNYPGWLADMITETNCGYSITPDNPVEFAETLIKIAADRKDLHLKGLNGRKLAEGQFNRVDLAQKFVRWLTS